MDIIYCSDQNQSNLLPRLLLLPKSLLLDPIKARGVREEESLKCLPCKWQDSVEGFGGHFGVLVAVSVLNPFLVDANFLFWFLSDKGFDHITLP